MYQQTHLREKRGKELTKLRVLISTSSERKFSYIIIGSEQLSVVLLADHSAVCSVILLYHP